ncbi:MAG: hypothetical protein ACREJ2_00980 [Planctomycetota bacterium]
MPNAPNTARCTGEIYARTKSAGRLTGWGKAMSPPLPPPSSESAARLNSQHLIQTLRFRLSNDADDGNLRFHKVHVIDPLAPQQRVEFLILLMEGRTIVEVLHDLTPQAGPAVGRKEDSVTALELRAYFQQLAQVVHVHIAG